MRGAVLMTDPDPASLLELPFIVLPEATGPGRHHSHLLRRQLAPWAGDHHEHRGNSPARHRPYRKAKMPARRFTGRCRTTSGRGT